MTISDETLMAYLDNELTAGEREHVAAALRNDAELRARLARQQKVHEKLDLAFGPLVREPVPEHLVNLAMTAPVSWRWRAREAWKGFTSGGTSVRAVPRYAFAMVTLVVGIAVGWVVSTATMQEPGGGGAIMAEGALARALETRLAADDSVAGPRVGVTFVAKSGEFCRTFDLALAADNAAGFACRSGDGWALKAMVPAEPRTNEGYATASAGIPGAIRSVVMNAIDGEPLDADAERRARDSNWSR